MAFYKGTFFFREFAQGWTETYFKQGSSIDGVLAAFNDLVNGLIAIRADQVNLDSVRISQDQPFAPRVARLVRINLSGARPVSMGAEAEDVAQTCEMLNVTAADGVIRAHMLRGLFDPDVQRDPIRGSAQPSAALVFANTYLRGKLLTNQICVRHYDPTSPKIFVFAVGSATVPGFTSITLPAGHGFSLGDRVRFLGVPLPKVPWLKGIWSVVGVGATFINIAYNYPLPAPLIPTSMFAVPVVFTYPTITDLSFIDFRSRKTGRPTSLTRGRSRGIPFRRASRAGG